MPKTSDLVQKTTLVAADEILIVDSAVVDPTSDEATKYVTEANFSAQVQDDLMANAAVTEATVATDTVPILASSVNSKITLQNLMIQMKGYKEYTFAIRQSGTDAPTIYVIKDDFNVGILPASRMGTGRYYITITDLLLTLGYRVNIVVSNTKPINAVDVNAIINDTDNVAILSAFNDSPTDGMLDNQTGSIISIRETLS